MSFFRQLGVLLGLVPAALGDGQAVQEEPTNSNVQTIMAQVDGLIEVLASRPVQPEELLGDWGEILTVQGHVVEASSSLEGTASAQMVIHPDTRVVSAITLRLNEDSGVSFELLQPRMGERIPAPAPNGGDPSTHHFQLQLPDTRAFNVNAHVRLKSSSKSTARSPVLALTLQQWPISTKTTP